MRFILKIINPIIKHKTEDLIYLLNYQDENNELFGMKILNGKLEKKKYLLDNPDNKYNLIKDLMIMAINYTQIVVYLYTI